MHSRTGTPPRSVSTTVAIWPCSPRTETALASPPPSRSVVTSWPTKPCQCSSSIAGVVGAQPVRSSRSASSAASAIARSPTAATAKFIGHGNPSPAATTSASPTPSRRRAGVAAVRHAVMVHASVANASR